MMCRWKWGFPIGIAFSWTFQVVAPSLGAQHVTKSPRIPLDPAVRMGTLPNGMRYYIRHNAYPAERVDISLVVNAGSVLEDDDQRGLAHFVEHVAFNGSTHFPSHQLWKSFPSLGIQIGADVNASTSYDETVYQIELPSTASVLDTACLILNDWAHEVTFDPEELASERGIIMEERRINLGPQLRQLDRFAPTMYGARYALRNPIGLGEIIQHAPRAAIMRFYKDWYRPDLETLILVGDFDAAAMERRIIAEFGRIPMPASPRVRPPLRVTVHDTAVAVVYADPQVSTYSADVIFPQSEHDTVETEATIREQTSEQIFVNVLNNRLASLVRQKNAPVSAAMISTTTLGRYIPAFDLNLTATEPTTLELGITAVMAEVARLARDGATVNEVTTAQKALTDGAVGDTLATRAPASRNLWNTYIQDAIARKPVVDPKVVALLNLRFAKEMTSTDIQAVAQTIIATRGPEIFVAIPKDDRYGRPESDVLISALNDGITRMTPPYRDSTDEPALLTAVPPRGHIVHERTLPSIGVTEWTLSNGARILLKPTAFTRGDLTVRAVSLGGTSVASDRDYPNAAVASDLVQRSGLGPYDAQTLARHLGSQVSAWNVTIGADSVDASVSSTRRNAETMFQLLYLAFTAPRLDSAAVDKWRTDARRQDISGIRLEVLRAESQHNPRMRPVIGALADSVDAPTALNFYRASFADAGHFAFVIVGDFTADDLRPLIEQYIGGLPGHPEDTLYYGRDLGIRPPTTIVQRAVMGDDSASTTAVVFTTPVPTTVQSNAVLQALDVILDQRVFTRLRQQLNGAYSPMVQCTLELLPYRHAVAQIRFTSAPERAAELQQALFALLDTLVSSGITPEESRTIRLQLERQRETESQTNAYWTDVLANTVFTSQSLDAIETWKHEVAAVTPSVINAMARTLLDPLRYVQVTALPARLMPAQQDEMLSARQW